MTQSSDFRQPAPRIRELDALNEVARRLRCRVIEMVAPSGQGYVQQGLGAADIFSALYFGELRLDPGDGGWEDRDRAILSTAHNTAVFYAALAERGMVEAEAIDGYCKDGSPFEINASERVGTAVEATCGSLGQGLSVGAGIALATRRRGSDSRTFVILGDGELQEGQVWEAALFAATHRIANLTAIIDYNHMQVEGDVAKVAALEPLAEKWRSFGWSVIDVDGHDIAALLEAFDRARQTADRPTCIVANTMPGKGVPEFESILAHNLILPADAAARALAILQS